MGKLILFGKRLRALLMMTVDPGHPRAYRLWRTAPSGRHCRLGADGIDDKVLGTMTGAENCPA